MEKALRDFLCHNINKSQLQSKIGENLHQVELDKPVVIDNLDVIAILEKFKDGVISLNDLVEWVNVVWFTELYDYDDEYQNSIASVMSELEELDEEGKELTQASIEMYIETIRSNKEL